MANAATLDEKYAKLHAVAAGKLPADRYAVLDWHRNFRERVVCQPEVPMHTSVVEFERLLNSDGVLRMLVSEMIDEVDPENRHVSDISELLAQLNHIVTEAPVWEEIEARRCFFPMSNLFTYMMMTEAGEAVFRHRLMNDALRLILREWCAYLDSPPSRHVINDGPHGWLSPGAWAYNELDQFVIPDPQGEHGGFASFNAYFHREIKPIARPVAGPGEPRVVVSPNDGKVYRVARRVELETQFWLKEQPYSLRDMLAGSELTETFVDGDVLQSYLSGADYHRWHAPVAGKVLATTVIEGLMFSNLSGLGNAIKGVSGQGYYTAVNTRGLVFIEADYKPLGIVCVMPVGITEISSITHTVAVGEHVEKGQEIGRFSYGGSSMAVLFQPGTIDFFDVSDPSSSGESETIQVNAAIAAAN